MFFIYGTKYLERNILYFLFILNGILCYDNIKYEKDDENERKWVYMIKCIPAYHVYQLLLHIMV